MESKMIENLMLAFIGLYGIGIIFIYAKSKGVL